VLFALITYFDFPTFRLARFIHPFLIAAGAILAFVIRRRHFKARKLYRMQAHHFGHSNPVAPVTPAAPTPEPVQQFTPFDLPEPRRRRCGRFDRCDRCDVRTEASSTTRNETSPNTQDAAKTAPALGRRAWRVASPEHTAAASPPPIVSIVSPAPTTKVVVEPADGTATTDSTAASTNNEHPFRQAMLRLQAMGFTDPQRNRRALRRSQGDVNGAVAFLIEERSQ